MSEYNLSYTASEINTKLRKIDILDANKLDASELPSAINTALAQAKASGTFDGADGKNGTNGKDGRTPVKGTDYYTAADKQEMINAVIAALPVYTGEAEVL